MRPDPRHLAQLSMIIEAGSFQNAAERLGLTQPALSRNIRILEERIGSQVLDRSSRKAVPTLLGAKMAELGYAIRIASEQADSLSNRASAGEIGEVRIGAPPIIAGHYMAARITRFMQENPGCRVELKVGLVHELRTMLERGQIDLVVGPRNLMDRGAPLEFRPILNDRVGILCRIGHPLCNRRSLDPGSLEHQTWVAHSRGSMLRQQTEAALIAMGIERLQIGFETDSIESVLEVVAATDMISTLPRLSTQPYLRDRLVFLDLDHELFSRPIGIISREDGAVNQAVERFMHLLHSPEVT